MFSKALIATCFAAVAAAQSAVLTFTHVPNPVTDGQAQAITYSTNDTTTPVTIILRKGASTDLQTVSTLTTTATGGQFIWTPSKSLADGIDYALQIKQGDQSNYFGPFAVQGADPSAVAAASSSSSSVSTSSSAVAASNATMTTPVGTVGTVGSMGATGTAMPRNATMSMATLTSSGSATATMVSSTGSESGAGFQGGSSTASGAAATSSSEAFAMQISGALSLVLGAAAAAFYL